MKYGVPEVKRRLKQAWRSDMSNDSDKSGPGDKPDSPDPRVTRGFGIVLRLLSACLLACLTVPLPVQAGGDLGKKPYEIGEKYFLRKDYRTALKHYRKALERGDARADYRMGLIFEAAGKNRDALKHYERFIERGQPGAERSESAQRLKAIQERLGSETTVSTGLLERGKSLFRAGKYREAEKVLVRAAAKDQSRAEVHFYLGEVYMQLEAYDKAKSEYTKAKKYY